MCPYRLLQSSREKAVETVREREKEIDRRAQFRTSALINQHSTIRCRCHRRRHCWLPSAAAAAGYAAMTTTSDVAAPMATTTPAYCCDVVVAADVDVAADAADVTTVGGDGILDADFCMDDDVGVVVGSGEAGAAAAADGGDAGGG